MSFNLESVVRSTINELEEKNEEARNELENNEPEEERERIKKIIYANIIYESKEDGQIPVKTVVVNIDSLISYFSPWIAQRDLVQEHVEQLAHSILKNPGVMPTFAAIIDINGNRKLMDGLQRQAALTALRDAFRSRDILFEKEIRIDIYEVESHLGEECYQLFERLNKKFESRQKRHSRCFMRRSV